MHHFQIKLLYEHKKQNKKDTFNILAIDPECKILP